MSYMMSKQQHLNDGAHPNWIAHVMIYTPLMHGAVWWCGFAPISHHAEIRSSGSPSGTADFSVMGDRGKSAPPNGTVHERSVNHDVSYPIGVSTIVKVLLFRHHVAHGSQAPEAAAFA